MTDAAEVFCERSRRPDVATSAVPIVAWEPPSSAILILASPICVRALPPCVASKSCSPSPSAICCCGRMGYFRSRQGGKARSLSTNFYGCPHPFIRVEQSQLSPIGEPQASLSFPLESLKLKAVSFRTNTSAAPEIPSLSPKVRAAASDPEFQLALSRSMMSRAGAPDRWQNLKAARFFTCLPFSGTVTWLDVREAPAVF
jgi:hypothetical protein